MTCKHCGQPISRCNGIAGGQHECRGWRHSAGLHYCALTPPQAEPDTAEPEPGSLPAVEAPASEPRGEVA